MRHRLTVAAITLAAALAAAWIALNAERGLPGSSHYDLTVELPDLANLSENDDVRIAGRRVGQVLEQRSAEDGVEVAVQLAPGLAGLPADTRATVRAKGLLGARYLELQPGRATERLADGATIPRGQTAVGLELADVLKAFDPPTRTALGETIGGFGQGLAGRGTSLNEMLGELPGLLRDTGSLSEAVLSRNGAAARLAPSVESGLAGFDVARDSLARGFSAQERGLRPFAAASADVRRLLRAAPEELSGTRSGLAGSGPLLAQARALAGAARGTLDEAPAALTETTRLLVEGRGPLERSAPLLDRLRTAAPAATKLVRRLHPVLPPLGRGLRSTRPTVATLRAYGCDLEGWAANWRSMLEWGVPGGGEIGPLTIFRTALVTTPESLGRSATGGPAPPIGTNAYPEPCEAGSEELP